MKKIFVIGRDRSGTKWLSNLLANHNGISAVQREGAGGILESNVLRNYDKIFDLTNREDRSAFEILFKQDNFYKCAAVQPEQIDFENTTHFYPFFEYFMDAFAQKNGTNAWVQKTSSLTLPKVVEKIPESKIILIQRDVVSNVISSALLNNRQLTNVGLLKNTLSYREHRKIEKKYQNLKNVYVVKYEDLKKNPESVIKDLCNWLDIRYDKEMLQVVYRPNTSYKKNKEQYYSKPTIRKVKFYSFWLSLIPLKVIRWIKIIKNIKKRGEYLQPLTFSIYRAEK